MKVNDIDVNDLSDGTYYYCANCKHWFGRQQPSSDSRCPHCERSWGKTQGRYRKTTTESSGEYVITSPEKSGSGCIFTVLMLYLFSVISYGLYQEARSSALKARSSAQRFWTNLADDIWEVVEFMASLFISLAVLGAATGVLFFLFKGIIYLVGFLLFAVASIFRRNKGLFVGAWTGGFVEEHAVFADSLANLLAGGSNLLLLSWLAQRPLNYGDLGVQGLIALAIEFVIVFRSPARRSPANRQRRTPHSSQLKAKAS
jgi:hypothetical protein